MHLKWKEYDSVLFFLVSQEVASDCLTKIFRIFDLTFLDVLEQILFDLCIQLINFQPERKTEITFLDCLLLEKFYFLHHLAIYKTLGQKKNKLLQARMSEKMSKI